MNKALTVALALGAGLMGGLLTRSIAPPAAFAQNQAQNQAPVAKEIRAQSFTLVDSSDHTLGVFTAESAPNALRTRIVLRDANGRELWSAGGSGIRPVTER